MANNGWIDIEMAKTLSRPLSQQNPNRDGPIWKPGLDLLEKDEAKSKRPSMWNIVFYKDDYKSMDFVVFVLTRVSHRSTEDALALTAEQKQCEVLLMAKIEEHPLRVEVERA
jgi:ATP-dependent Clp protease adapter protein ClpS